MQAIENDWKRSACPADTQVRAIGNDQDPVSGASATLKSRMHRGTVSPSPVFMIPSLWLSCAAFAAPSPFVLLNGSHPHPALGYSFPTRRSSDLRGGPRRQGKWAAKARGRSASEALAASTTQDHGPACTLQVAAGPLPPQHRGNCDKQRDRHHHGNGHRSELGLGLRCMPMARADSEGWSIAARTARTPAKSEACRKKNNQMLP